MSRLGIALVVVAVGVGVVGLVAIGGEARLIQTKPLPPPVQGVSVLHRAGQTFIRWLELDLVPRRELTAVELAAARELVEKSSRLRYRVYRSDRPIQRREDATLVGEVLPFSGWDVEHFGKAPPKGVPLPRFIIQEGDGVLPLGTGLFVHNPPKPGPAHYLVTVSVNGVENPAVTTENVTSVPVTETVGPGVPVLQRVEKPAQFQYISGATLRFYVRWEPAGHSNVPGKPFNYLVGLPPGLREPAPVGLHLHCWGGSMTDCFGWWFNAGKGAVLVAPNQEPYDWWTGYHELLGRVPQTSRDEWARGVVRPYTQRRLLGFVDWLATTMKLDLSRFFAAGVSMGGAGSIMLAIRHPDRIAWTMSWVGVHVPTGTPQFRSSYEDMYGRPELNVRFEDGTPVWDYFNDVWYLRRYPEHRVGLIVFSNGKNDGVIGWGQAVEFFRALQETRQPHIFFWGQNSHGERAYMPAKGGERENPLDLRVDQSLPAFTRGTLDDNPGSGTPESGAPTGQANYHLTWETASIVDEPDRWSVRISVVEGAPKPEAAADVTPRRLQQFKLKPGDRVAWAASVGNSIVQQGELVADQWGLVTLPQVQIKPGGTRITLTRR